MKDAYMDWFIHHFIQPPRQARVRLLAYTGGPVAAHQLANSLPRWLNNDVQHLRRGMMREYRAQINGMAHFPALVTDFNDARTLALGELQPQRCKLRLVISPAAGKFFLFDQTGDVWIGCI
ncbi:hypothetical protein C1Y42_19605 [Pantoea sp. ICBG 985]|jgi:hypothetical protein|nr:hypothetical protein C1Y42_19605 [Pantoea sp. ICBG 985]